MHRIGGGKKQKNNIGGPVNQLIKKIWFHLLFIYCPSNQLARRRSDCLGSTKKDIAAWGPPFYIIIYAYCLIYILRPRPHPTSL
jgi:hypothetical protein